MGGVNLGLISLALQKSEKDWTVNWGPLSVTISSGNPKFVKKVCNALMVVAAVALRSGIASIHFEWTSIVTNTCQPSISAKLRCNLFIGWFAHGQLGSGATGVKLLCVAQSLQLLTSSSMFLFLGGYNGAP